MKYLIVAMMVGGLCACATAPTVSQVQAIQNACAIDAGVRPIATELLAIPGLAQTAEIAAVVAARGVIDTICANPNASVETNAIASLTGASAQIVEVITTLKARQTSKR